MSLGAIAGVARVARAASETLAPAERARSVLAELRALIPFDHAEIAFDDPFSGGRRLLANDGYPDDLVEHLNGQQFDEEIRDLNLHETGVPVRMRDVPGDRLAVRSIAEVLKPAGYAEGMTMVLRTGDGRPTGVLNMSTGDERHPTDEAREIARALGPALANVADATQSARQLVALLGPGARAVAVDRQGAVIGLPGIQGHRQLEEGSRLMDVAAAVAARADGSTRFLVPCDGCRRWHRAGVTSCVDRASACAAIAWLDPAPVPLELTRRELEVLTMVTSGWSNAEIGARLWISPRTVGTYVEQILAKLDVPTRAAAAARAVAEGLITPLGPPAAGEPPPAP